MGGSYAMNLRQVSRDDGGFLDLLDRAEKEGQTMSAGIPNMFTNYLAVDQAN